MIEKIELKNFKRFNDSSIETHPHGITYIVGSNNAGKSSILHALAVWEFCKSMLIYAKGPISVTQDFKGDGYGIAFSDFTPLNIPSFKYLWSNLKILGGYSLSIKCYWTDKELNEKYLEILLSLVQERLFIKRGKSNLTSEDSIPRIAYLPTFAGISPKEQWYSPAMRQHLIGQGLAGAVLRNEILDLFNENQRIRKEKKGDKKKLSKKDLEDIRATDPYEKLQQVLFSIFKGILSPLPFNSRYNTHVGVEFEKGEIRNGRYFKYKNYNKRDIMVEGRGFLQWLSVYTFALSPNIDVLLLDEPDAHLHVSLQTCLVDELKKISEKFNKQIFIATHSVEVIKSAPMSDVLHVKGPKDIKYLSKEADKVIVLSGLGATFFPRLESIQKYKRILFVENESDANFLKFMSSTFMKWPENLVVWPMADKHNQRSHIFKYLKGELNNQLKCISLIDRDEHAYGNIGPNLEDKSMKGDIKEGENEIRYRMWRRSEIENYLLHPDVIARLIFAKNPQKYNDIATAKEALLTYISTNHGTTINENFMASEQTNATKPLFELTGKDIINGIEKEFCIKKFDIAKEMKEDEVFEDIKKFCNELNEMCS